MKVNNGYSLHGCLRQFKNYLQYCIITFNPLTSCIGTLIVYRVKLAPLELRNRQINIFKTKTYFISLKYKKSVFLLLIKSQFKNYLQYCIITFNPLTSCIGRLVV